MPYDRILVGVLAIVFIAAFILFMQYSRPGRAMRALAQDRVAAQLMGVEVDRYSMIGFALGAMLAGIVGGLLVSITGVNSGIGGPISIKAFMMVMIGGAGVVGGAIAGGFILGMMESVGLTVLRDYGDITYLVIFAALMVFLAIRPQRADGQAVGLMRHDTHRKNRLDRRVPRRRLRPRPGAHRGERTDRPLLHADLGGAAQHRQRRRLAHLLHRPHQYRPGRLCADRRLRLGHPGRRPTAGRSG